VAVIAIFAFLRFSKNPRKIQTLMPQTKKSAQDVQAESKWQEKGVAISGQYADAEVVDLGNGQYRMYYSIEPEVPGNNLEVYSAVSSDGINWEKESGIRKTFATFPDIVKLPDGRWRMYFQNAGVIKSAISTDGLSWTDEPGVRIGKSESGFNLEDVGAQGTIRLDDGTYIMLYRGTINEPYRTREKIPNQDTHIYFWATSKDGLTFEKKGLAIDSRNDILLGAADGAEWVRWDDGELRVYFWSYAGVYHVIYNASLQERSDVIASDYKDGTFSQPVFDFTNKQSFSSNKQSFSSNKQSFSSNKQSFSSNKQSFSSNNKDPMAKFSPNPPADPTLAKINGKWFMYYGQHTKGINFATY